MKKSRGMGTNLGGKENLLTRRVSPPTLPPLPPPASLGLQVFKGGGKQVNVLRLWELGENASGIKQSLFIFKLPAQGFQKSFPKRH